MKEKYKMPDASVPCFNHLLSRYGPVSAAIYGKIWLYERMRHKECWASQERIAKELGISRKTVNRHIAILMHEDSKYIYCCGGKKGKKTLIYKTTELLADEVAINRLKNMAPEETVHIDAGDIPIWEEPEAISHNNLSQNEFLAGANCPTNKEFNKQKEYKNNTVNSPYEELSNNPNRLLHTSITQILSLNENEPGERMK